MQKVGHSSGVFDGKVARYIPMPRCVLFICREAGWLGLFSMLRGRIKINLCISSVAQRLDISRTVALSMDHQPLLGDESRLLRLCKVSIESWSTSNLLIDSGVTALVPSR